MIVGLLHRLSGKLPHVVYRISVMMKPQVVFVLGGPGAGKGTQCARIVEVREITTFIILAEKNYSRAKLCLINIRQRGFMGLVVC